MEYDNEAALFLATERFAPGTLKRHVSAGVVEDRVRKATIRILQGLKSHGHVDVYTSAPVWLGNKRRLINKHI